MHGWSRRIVLAKALDAVRYELAESARQIKCARDEEPRVRPALASHEGITRTDIEEALFDIDLFPRAALILLVLEKVRIADAIILLDADEPLIRKAQIIGLERFITHICRKEGLPTIIGNPESITGSIAC